MQCNNRFVRNKLLKVILAAACLLTWAGQLGAAGRAAYPDDAVIIRFSIDSASLESVRNSAELAEALHQGLALEAASPLDYEVTIHIQGHVYQGGDEQAHPAASGLFVDIDRGKPVNGRITDLRFYTFNDFSESEAWGYFQQQIQEALTYSMNSTGAFEMSGDGNVPLTVTAVLAGTEAIEPDGSSMVLKLMPETVYRDGSKFGSKVPPAGYTQQVETIQIVLAPAEATVAAVSPATDTLVATTWPGGIIGTYGADGGALSIQEVDGQLAMSNPNAMEAEQWPLKEVGEARYSTVFNGNPVELRFSMDDDGQAFAVTIIQGDREMKMPRQQSGES
jgi:hypothetical protein